eukprot:5642570-Prymnesium_polylepis.2
MQGLQTGVSSASVIVRGDVILNETQLASLAVVRLAHDPPRMTGRMQRRTTHKLLRAAADDQTADLAQHLCSLKSRPDPAASL